MPMVRTRKFGTIWGIHCAGEVCGSWRLPRIGEHWRFSRHGRCPLQSGRGPGAEWRIGCGDRVPEAGNRNQSRSFSAAYNNLGSALLIAGRFDEAETALDRAIQLRPDLAEAHFTRSLIWLMRGDFEKGWAEYEWRLRGDQYSCTGATKFNQPRWDGGDLNGRTILLHAEAGLGDSMQFVRYAPLWPGAGDG